MKHVVTKHYLSHFYGALKSNKVEWDQLCSKIEALKANSSGESNKKKLSELSIRQTQVYFVIVILTNCMIEALVNHYLANKCDAEQFEMLERLSTLDKLANVPKLLLKEYKSPKGEAFYEDLTHLLSLRTSMVHSKPKVDINGQIVHKGNLAKQISASTLTVDKCLSLPVRLVEHFCLYDHGGAFELRVYSGFDAADIKKIISKVQAKSAEQRGAQ